MSNTQALTIAFMRSHAAEAAQVLESAAPATLAELFAAVPVRVGGPVLAELQPRAAAAVLSALPIERAAALIEKLGQQPSVVILRHVDEPLRVQLLAQLPAATAFATRLLLGYPDDSVGACVNPNVVAVLAVTLVGDLLEKVRNLDAAVDEVFVVDTERRLLGWVRLDSVLRASESTAVGSLLLAAPAVLPARMPLAGALAHPGWQGGSALPVVERGDRLLGVLTRDALIRALARARRLARDDDAAETLVSVLAGSYWQSLSGIIETLTATLPTIRPVAGERSEH